MEGLEGSGSEPTVQQLADSLHGMEKLPVRDHDAEERISKRLDAAKAKAHVAKPVSQQMQAHSHKLRRLESKVSKQQKKHDADLLNTAKAAKELEDLQRTAERTLADAQRITAESQAALLTAQDELAECHKALGECRSLAESKAESSQLGSKLDNSLNNLVAGAVLSRTAGGSQECADEMLASFIKQVTEDAVEKNQTALSAQQHNMAEAECARAAAAAESNAATTTAVPRDLREELAACGEGVAASEAQGNSEAEARSGRAEHKEAHCAGAARLRSDGRSRSPVGGGAATAISPA